jgi:hypothetical protein
MARYQRKRKCKHCKVFFDPDARNVGRQSYCSKPPCRKASKAASQRRWLGKPQNRTYFRGPVHCERVRQWRKDHPGYWRRKGTFAKDALQDTLTTQRLQKQQLEGRLTQHALQDSLFVHPAVFVGLIAHLSGLSLQDDIEQTARRLQQLGLDILSRPTRKRGDPDGAQIPHLAIQTQEVARAIQLDRPAPGP